MSKADEMFEKLNNIAYKITKEDNEEIISERYLFKNNKGEFGFNYLTKRIEILKEYNEITLEELQAINEKVKESGWLDDN